MTECRTQAELSAALAAGEIPELVDDGLFVLQGNAAALAYGNATVLAYDNTKVDAYGNVAVRAYDNAAVRVSGNATVEEMPGFTGTIRRL